MSVDSAGKAFTEHPQSEALLAKQLEAKATKGLIGRHVAWLKQPRGKATNAGIALLVAGEIALLTLSVVGLIALVKAAEASSKLDTYRQKQQDSRIATAPERSAIELKSPTRSFNHINDFAINDGKLWYRPRNELTADWQLMYFDQLDQKNPPAELRADGANLMVKDKSGAIHYKKVLKEWYGRDDAYCCKDLTAKDNWYDHWFSFPVVRHLVNFFTQKRICIPDDCVAWTMSHRGKYTRYFEDVDHKKHPEVPMVTTLYVIPKDGKDILYADPFLVNKFGYRIKGPDLDFRGTNIAASASTIFLVGVLDGKVCMFTRLADFDTLGKNPILPGFWNRKARGQTEWKQEPAIPLEGKAEVSQNITIFQDGEGNDHRELRVEGTDKDGKAGYYYKHVSPDKPVDQTKIIEEEQWKFKAF